ncbi:MAG: cobalamin biosynthesis protein CobW [Rhodospirillales bacterium]|jgi:cobalamin biosynthesis protein CobW|nr:cobalamin biosynthesis protein CobW [Rhodospirillales bacterium]
MKIPATVITGFLGAGKTTLIRHILANANGRRIALIINEFGDIGIDRDVINGCAIEGCAEEDVLELANGCICCTVADDFLPTMEKLLNRAEPPDHIVIETSGLALPKPLVKAFNWPQIRSRVTVDGVIAVVDGPAVAAGRFADDPDKVQAVREADDNLDHHSPLEEVFEDQLLCADLVLMNKADLLSVSDKPGVLEILKRETRNGVKIVETVKGNIDLKVLLAMSAAVEDDLEGRPSHHDGDDDHDHDEFESFNVGLGDIDDTDALEARIKTASLDHDILRIKGFVHVPGKPMRHVVQAVGPRIDRYFDRPWADGEVRQSRLVVIGLAGMDRTAIERALRG